MSRRLGILWHISGRSGLLDWMTPLLHARESRRILQFFGERDTSPWLPPGSCLTDPLAKRGGLGGAKFDSCYTNSTT